MEIFPYLIDVIVFTFAIYWSGANAVRDEGTNTFGLFRYRESRKGGEKLTAAQKLGIVPVPKK